MGNTVLDSTRLDHKRTRAKLLLHSKLGCPKLMFISRLKAMVCDEFNKKQGTDNNEVGSSLIIRSVVVVFREMSSSVPVCQHKYSMIIVHICLFLGLP